MTRTGRLVGAAIPLATLLVVALLPVAAVADDIAVRADVDRTSTSVNQPITFTVTVEGTMRSVPTPKLPDLSSAFSVRDAGTSSNMSWVNGAMSASKSWNYVLLPKATGTFTIGSAEVEFGGSVYRTDPIEVRVVEGGASQGQSAPGGSTLEERRSSGVDSRGRDIFITATVDKKRAYVDEQITLSFKFYRRIDLWEQPRYQPPDLTGFWVEDLGQEAEYLETVNGIRYRVIEIRTALFGAAPGKATIGPATLAYREGGGGFPFFGVGEERALKTDAIAVEVLALPAEGKPPGFGGGVGIYSVKASLEPTSVAQLQPVTLKVTIAGTGNTKTVPAPKISDLPDFKIYESGTSSDVTKKSGVVGGVRAYEYVLVPQTPGAKTIPAITVAFFDPKEKVYRTSSTGDLALEVTPAAPGATEPEIAVRAPIERLGRDVEYIHEPTGTLAPAARPLHARPSFLLLQALPAVALALVYVGRRRRDRLAGDEGLARFVRAPAAARRDLRAAAGSLKGGDRAAACSALARAVTDFIGHRWNVPARAMTMQELEETMRSGGAGDELVAQVRKLLGECDLGRFAGSVESVDGESLLGDAEACLQALARLSAKRRR